MKKISIFLLLFSYLSVQQTRMNMRPNINDPKAKKLYFTHGFLFIFG